MYVLLPVHNMTIVETTLYVLEQVPQNWSNVAGNDLAPWMCRLRLDGPISPCRGAPVPFRSAQMRAYEVSEVRGASKIHWPIDIPESLPFRRQKWPELA